MDSVKLSSSHTDEVYPNTQCVIEFKMVTAPNNSRSNLAKKTKE
jgi:hypothetical protein